MSMFSKALIIIIVQLSLVFFVLFISFYFVAQCWMDSEDICVTIFIPFLGIGTGLILWLSIGSIIGLFMPTIDIKETKELYALQDGNEISGSFFLGSGRIDEEMHYVYIVKEDRGKQMQTLKIETKEKINELKIKEREHFDNLYNIYLQKEKSLSEAKMIYQTYIDQQKETKPKKLKSKPRPKKLQEEEVVNTEECNNEVIKQDAFF